MDIVGLQNFLNHTRAVLKFLQGFVSFVFQLLAMPFSKVFLGLGSHSEAVRIQSRCSVFKTSPSPTNKKKLENPEPACLDFSFLYILVKWEDLTRMVLPNHFCIVNICSAYWTSGGYMEALTWWLVKSFVFSL